MQNNEQNVGTGKDAAAAKPPSPRLWTVLVAYAGLWATIGALGMAVYTLAAHQMGLQESIWTSQEALDSVAHRVVRSPVWGAVAVLVTSAVCATFAGIGAILAREPWQQRLRLQIRRFAVQVWLGSAIAVIAAAQLLGAMLSLAGIELSGSLLDMRFAARSADAVVLLAFALAVVVAAPLGEELFFRGFMQTRLSQRLGAPAAIVCTAAAFGLLHGDLLHSPMAAVLGLVLGWVVEASGSVWPAVGAHALVNLTWLLAARVGTDEATPVSTTYADAVVAAGALIFLALGLWLVRAHTPLKTHAS